MEVVNGGRRPIKLSTGSPNCHASERPYSGLNNSGVGSDSGDGSLLEFPNLASRSYSMTLRSEPERLKDSSFTADAVSPTALFGGNASPEAGGFAVRFVVATRCAFVAMKLMSLGCARQNWVALISPQSSD